jgi:Raf kinase inhibitor-like YbhB/YbcL family protein
MAVVRGTFHARVIFACLWCGFAGAGDDAVFVLSSPTLHDGQPMPQSAYSDSYGCTGGNRSPALSWSHPPANTKSFAIMMFDQDEMGSGSGWWHWIVYDVPASATELPEDAGASNSKALPRGAVQGRTDFGVKRYDGPCPDAGDPPHRYIITLFALNTPKLELPPDATPAMISYQIHRVTLAKASIVAPCANPSSKAK